MTDESTDDGVEWAMTGDASWRKYESDLPVYAAWCVLRDEVKRYRELERRMRELVRIRWYQAYDDWVSSEDVLMILDGKLPDWWGQGVGWDDCDKAAKE